MKISIIISVYNIEAYLESCVNSVLQQKYKNWECILVDDGSVDNSGYLCDKFSEKYENIRVIHQKNKGLSGARNSGLKVAEGEYVYFIDGDDEIAENTLNNFLSLIDDTYPDMILGHMSMFGVDKILKPYGKIVEDKWLRDKSGKDGFVEIYKNNGIIFMGIRGLYRKDFLLNYQLFFNESFRYSEDQEWTPRCFKNARIVRSNENRDYYYRAGRTGSLMNTIDCRKIELTLFIYDAWYKEILRFPDDKFYLCLYQMMIERIWSFYFQYPPMLNKAGLNKFYEILAERKYFVVEKPKEINLSKKMWIIKRFTTKQICIMAKFWKKIHRE